MSFCGKQSQCNGCIYGTCSWHDTLLLIADAAATPLPLSLSSFSVMLSYHHLLLEHALKSHSMVALPHTFLLGFSLSCILQSSLPSLQHTLLICNHCTRSIIYHSNVLHIVCSSISFLCCLLYHIYAFVCFLIFQLLFHSHSKHFSCCFPVDLQGDLFSELS